MDAATIAAATTSAKNLRCLATSATYRINNLEDTLASLKHCRVIFPSHQRDSYPNLRNTTLRCSTKYNNVHSDSHQANSDSAIEPETGSSNADEVGNREGQEAASGGTKCLNKFSSVSNAGLLLDLGPVNSWDSTDIGSPVVKRFLSDEEERWYMWYHGSSSGSPNADLVGLAVSSNGVHWERGGGPVNSSNDVGLVMKRSEDWWAFDTQSIRPCEVVIMSSSKVRVASAVYWLYYTGTGTEEVENLEHCGKGSAVIYKSLPGLAISQDGRHWARIEGDHHTGALFDVGSDDEWDSTLIASPSVVFHRSGDLRMYYHSLDAKTGEFSIGMARSRDGMKWVKLGKVMGGGARGCFDELGAMNPCVVSCRKDDVRYIMAYEGVDAQGRRAIGLATSPDGLKDWKRVQDEAILKASDEDGWDNAGVGSPCLVHMDGEADEWRLYYRGFGSESGIGIGMAFSQGCDLSRFCRWKGFHM